MCHFACLRMHVGITGQLAGVRSLLLPCRAWGLNLDHQTWHQAPLCPDSHPIPPFFSSAFMISVSPAVPGVRLKLASGSRLF